MMSASHLATALESQLTGKSWVNVGTELTEFCNALATAIVAEVAAARITIPVTAVALQTSTTAGTPTAAPPAPVPIDGAIS